MSRGNKSHRKRRQTADAGTSRKTSTPASSETTTKHLGPLLLPALIIVAAVCAAAGTFAIIRLTESHPILDRLPEPPSFKGEVGALKKTVKAAYKTIRKTVYSDPTDKQLAADIGRLADIYISVSYTHLRAHET